MRVSRALVTGVMMACLVVLAGCATATPYQPLSDGEGYQDQRLEAQRYRVSFVGNALTSRDTVENYLLYRAAEITVRSGHDLFTVVNRDVEPITRYTGSFSVGTGFGGFYDPFGFGISTGTASPVTNYRAIMTIVVSDGDKPPLAIQTYNARDLMQRLESVILRPDEASDP